MIKKILYVLDNRQKRNLLIIFIMMFIGAFVELLGVSSVQPLVDVVTEPSMMNTNPLYAKIAQIFNVSDPRGFVLLVAVGMIILYVIKNLYVILENDVQYRFIYHNQKVLSTRMLDSYLYEDYLDHINKNVADLHRNITSDISNFFYSVIRILQFSMELLVCITLFFYLLFTDVEVTSVITGLLAVITGIFMLFYRRASVANGKEERRTSGLMNRWILESMGALKEIKIGNYEKYFSDNYNRIYGEYAETKRHQAMLEILPKPVMETTAICGLLAAIIIKALRGQDLAAFIPVMSVFVVAAFRLMPSFNRLTAFYSGIMYGKPYVESVYKDLKRFAVNSEKEKAVQNDPIKDFHIDDDVKINNITFRYPATEKRILDDISLVLPLNQTVALIGESGAGKSTLANVILGLLKPERGSITVGEYNMLNHIDSWHSRLGYIPQTIFLLDSSIRKNVAFAVDEDKIDEAAVIEALREAKLYDFVQTLPEGLDTIVGEGGVKLSGGQRQRIGIARALYTNPELLILDEATSALDNETEAAVMQSIDSLRGGHTMVIIAHRLSTIKNSDHIYEIADGKLFEKEKKLLFPEEEKAG